jgi:polyhydroxybutyrate depolymerase
MNHLFVLPLTWLSGCSGFATAPAAAPEAPPRVPASSATPPAGTLPPTPVMSLVPEALEGCLQAGTYRMPMEGDREPSLLVVGAGEGPRTLVLALHGGGGDGRKILMQTRWHTKAGLENLAVVAPTSQELGGHGPHWNSGKFDGRIDASTGRDDVAYLEAVVARAKELTCADRVVGIGFSNGGQMAHRLACQGDSLDAVISSAGTLLVDPSTCDRPVAMRSYVGDRDRIYTDSPMQGEQQPNVPESAALWAKVNGCSDEEPTVEATEAETCTTWTGCSVPTSLCVVHGMPHMWPAPWGKKSVPVDATTEGWAWYLAEVAK